MQSLMSNPKNSIDVEQMDNLDSTNPPSNKGGEKGHPVL